MRSLTKWLGFLFWTLSSGLYAESAYEKQVAFEEKITAQIVHKLDKVLAKDSYKVVVNGNLKLERLRVKVEEQVDQSATGMREKQKSEAVALPGFNVDRADQEGPRSNDLSKTSQTKYKYVENFNVDSLDVYLIYEQSLPEDRKALATSIIEKHLKSTFGDTANIIATATDVDAPAGTFSQRLYNWAASYLNLRGGTALDLLYLFIIGLLVLASILAIWDYFWRKSRYALNLAKSKLAGSEGQALAAKEAEGSKTEAKEAIGYIIEALTKDALVTQSFLRQLKYADKLTLISYIHSPALSEYLLRVLGIEASVRQDLAAAQSKYTPEKTESLKTIVEDLKHFQKLQDDFNTYRFGYLNLIDPKVLFSYFSGSDHMIEKLAIAAKYLPKQVYLSITDQLELDQKAALFARLREDKIDKNLLNEMEVELRDVFEKQKREISVPTGGDQLQLLMLDNDLMADQLIQEMKRQGVTISNDLKKYTVNMDNIFTQNETVVRRVLEELSNEVIAKAYAKSPQKFKLKDYMPENRFRLIEAMIARFHRIDDEQLKEAQLQFLSAYRVNA